MNVRIKIAEKLSPEFSRAAQRLRPELVAGMVEGLTLIQKRATGNIRAKFKSRTGRALRSVGIELPSVHGRKISGSVGLKPGKSFYMRVHEFGALIKAKTRKYLAIPQPGGGVRFVKRVVLPARAWFWPAVERSEKEIERNIEKRVERIFG